jgi:peptide/nickel transport system substrate-binding protein
MQIIAKALIGASILAFATLPLRAEPVHGLAMHGEPALPADFTHFPYANPDAPQGGEITYCVIGSFDNLNPFILRSLRSTARGMIDTIFGNLVFESLMVRSADEPFSLYGLLAESVEMPEDRSTIEFHIRPEAKWSDGRPVRPEDVIFTYEVFAEKGRPPYRDRMARIEKIEKTGERSVKFTFNDKADREFPLIVALTPVIPEHAFDKETFDQTTLKPLIGSGPYVVDRATPGERIVFKRDADYWGRDIPAKRGFDNYERISIDYFLNSNAQFEAFKKGLCATHTEADPVKRARGMDFPAAHDGRVVTETFQSGVPPVVTGFLFNTRLEKFSDPVVRRALAMLYDFEWANRNLFEGKYERTVSYWQGSELSALGVPASERERELLAPYADAVLPEIMDGTWRPPVTDGTGQDRRVLREAFDLFNSAGFQLEGGRMLDKNGRPFGFEILAASEAEQRLAGLYQRTLERLGIGVAVRMLDDTQMQQRKQRFDFEVLIAAQGFSNSLSPGTEQIGRWGSESADQEGSP